jgi:hypothetical protein
MKMKMKKVVSMSSPPMPKEVLDKLISAVIQEDGNERWSLNEDGSLDLHSE